MTLSMELKEFREGGSSDLSFDNSSKTWVCSDNLGQIRVLASNYESWSAKDATNGKCITAFAISPSGKQCCMAYDNAVHVHAYPNVETVELSSAVRITLAITKLEYDTTGKFIYMSTKEGDFRVYSLSSKSVIATIKTNFKPIKTFAVMPVKDDVLIALVTESSLLLYKISTPSDDEMYAANATMEYQSSAMIAKSVCSLNSSSGCQLSFCIDSDVVSLAVPSTKGSVSILHKKMGTDDDWEEALLVCTDTVITHGEVDVNLCLFSKNSKYLITSDVNGGLIVWSGSCTPSVQYSPISIIKNELGCALQGVRWLSNSAVICISNSHFTQKTITNEQSSAQSRQNEDVVSYLVPPTAVRSSSTQISSDTNESSSKRLKKHSEVVEEPENVDDLFESEEFLKAVTASEVSVAGPVLEKYLKNKAVAEAAALKESNAETVPQQQTSAAIDRARFIDDEEDLSDLGDDDDDDDADGGGFVSERIIEKPVLPTLQPAFQIASTSFDEQGRRYLLWNQVGNIISREEGNGVGSYRIEIRFSDANSRNRQEVLADHYGFNLAALSPSGALFSAPPEPMPEVLDPTDRVAIQEAAAGPGSVVQYFAFANAVKLSHDKTPNESFSCKLTHREAVVSLSCGDGWIALATNKGYLRILSTTGVNIATFRTKGEVVCSNGYKSKLAVVYHSGVPLDGVTPQLSMDLYEISKSCVSCTVTNRLTVSPGSKLAWIGFDTTEESIVSIDSNGVVSAFMRISTKNLSFEWCPVLEINTVKKSFDHQYWPVCVKGNRLLYVLLNGESKPSVYPQPVVSTTPYQIPITDLDVAGLKDKDNYNSIVRAALLESMRLTCAENERMVVEDSYNLKPTDDLHRTLQELDHKCSELALLNDKTTLQLFQSACQQGKLQYALDLVMRNIRSDRSFQAAITIANHHGRAPVARVIDTYWRAMKELNSGTVAASEPIIPAQAVSSQPKSVLKRPADSQEDIYTEDSAPRVKFSKTNEVSVLRDNSPGYSVSSPVKDSYSSSYSIESPPVAKKPPLNPFAVSQISASPSRAKPLSEEALKRKQQGLTVFDEIKQSLTTSPSPVKKNDPLQGSRIAPLGKQQTLSFQ